MAERTGCPVLLNLWSYVVFLKQVKYIMFVYSRAKWEPHPNPMGSISTIRQHHSNAAQFMSDRSRATASLQYRDVQLWSNLPDFRINDLSA